MASPAADVLCGVDIGTTHVKAALVTTDGAVLSVARASTPVTTDGHGPCHDPDDIRATAERVMRQAQQQAPAPARIGAVGVTSVGEEGVPLGPDGEVLYPSVAWYEKRPSAAERAWSARHGEDELFAVTGLHKDLGFTVFKWLWLRSAQPSVWSRCQTWLGLADYLTWRWTGQRGMSVSHASRTGVLSLADFRWRADWAAELLPCGLDTLPPLHEAGTTVGLLRAGVIPGLLTAAEVPVVATGLDHLVGAYAAGITRPGQLLDSLGTAEGLIEPVPSHRLEHAGPSLGTDFGAGILPRTHIAIAGLTAGAGVGAMLHALGADSAADQHRLEAAAAGLAPGADGLLYVPPRVRDAAPGALFGHQVSHGAAQLYRAVVEGWAMAAGNAMQQLGSTDRLQDVVCIGGGSTSALWVRVKASVLGREIYCLRTPEIVAVGAALLAGQAPAGPGPVTGWKPETSVVAPVPEWVPRYRALSQDFVRAAAGVHPGACPHVYP
ncbi:MAG TPA: FGGY family carbohydrate kinase [Trebonia sp.]|nr:FGGY family carbohydrate kinase [Trebonia sp.]